MIKRCTQCVLPETYPGITFDENGVCDQCRGYKPYKVRGYDKLVEFVDKYRGKGEKYDCIVALSGGRDSTFTLYYAVKKLGLRVLAFSVDNGCMPRETIENIQNAVTILGVDLVMHKHDQLQKSLKPFLSAWFKRPTPEMVASICLGCKYGIQLAYMQTAAKYKIPLFLSGGGEPEKSFAQGFYANRMQFLSPRLRLIWGQIKELLINPRYLLHPILLYRMFMEYLYNFSPRSVRRLLMKLHGCQDWVYLQLFNYIPWSEQEIMSTITTELKWQKYSESKASWRSDCTVNLVKNYFYNQTLGFTKNEEMVSNLIRQGVLTREEGFKRLENDNQIEQAYIENFCRAHNIRFEAQEVSRRIAEMCPSGEAAR